MRLLKISIHTNERTGADFRIRNIEVKETANSYVGEGNRISKDKLMRIDPTMYNTGAIIYFYTYCLPDNIKAAAQLLIKATNDQFQILKSKHEILSKSIEILNQSELANYLTHMKILD